VWAFNTALLPACPHPAKRPPSAFGDVEFGFQHCVGPTELHQRFRMLVAQCHPDAPNGCPERFCSVVSAYEARLKLSRAASRISLDDELTEALDELTAVVAALTLKTIRQAEAAVKAVGEDMLSRLDDTIDGAVDVGKIMLSRLDGTIAMDSATHTVTKLLTTAKQHLAFGPLSALAVVCVASGAQAAMH